MSTNQVFSHNFLQAVRADSWSVVGSDEFTDGLFQDICEELRRPLNGVAYSFETISEMLEKSGKFNQYVSDNETLDRTLSLLELSELLAITAAHLRLKDILRRKISDFEIAVTSHSMSSISHTIVERIACDLASVEWLDYLANIESHDLSSVSIGVDDMKPYVSYIYGEIWKLLRNVLDRRKAAVEDNFISDIHSLVLDRTSEGYYSNQIERILEVYDSTHETAWHDRYQENIIPDYYASIISEWIYDSIYAALNDTLESGKELLDNVLARVYDYIQSD